MNDQDHDPTVQNDVIEETRAFVFSRSAPDLRAGVMARIAALPVTSAQPGLARRLAERLWTPREVQLQWRPLYAVVAATIILFIVMLPAGRRAADTGPNVFVQFRLDAMDATDVRLAGSFTNWQPQYALHEASPGVWTITLPLAAGVHDYAFVVNGQRWIPDPYATQVDDGFGGVNSRIALVVPDVPRL